MPNAADFRELVSGRTRGVVPSVLRVACRAVALPYGLAVRLRNRRFDQSKGVTTVEVPVISVGNLTLGGTGKTPMVAWIARWFRSRGKRPVIVSRGYGASSNGRNDEALELEQQLPDVPHVQNPDRLAAARVAIGELECELILLDDGFQHRRIHRDLDIVLLDALCPFGFERLFPSGMLREPISALRRADMVVLTRADLISQEQCDWIKQRVRAAANHVIWATSRHAAKQLVSHAGKTAPLDLIRNQRVAAFCGIGNPAAFQKTLRSIPAEVADFLEFSDHCSFDESQRTKLEQFVRASDAELVVCTRKDIVKLTCDVIGGKPLWALDVELDFLVGEEAVCGRLENVG